MLNIHFFKTYKTITRCADIFIFQCLIRPFTRVVQELRRLSATLSLFTVIMSDNWPFVKPYLPQNSNTYVQTFYTPYSPILSSLYNGSFYLVLGIIHVICIEVVFPVILAIYSNWKDIQNLFTYFSLKGNAFFCFKNRSHSDW